MPQEKSTTVLDQPEVAERPASRRNSKTGTSEKPRRATKKVLALAGALSPIVAAAMWWWHARQ